MRSFKWQINQATLHKHKWSAVQRHMVCYLCSRLTYPSVLPWLPSLQAYTILHTAAPEKSAHLDGLIADPPMVSKNIDVWSLGCVFSEAATWVVLDTPGVLQYDRIRRVAHAKLNNESDAFHNVLKHVNEWHEYLRSAARGTDPFTSHVLDLVDAHMLVAADKRWHSDEVCKKLRDIIAENKGRAREVPTLIEGLLEDLEWNRQG